MSTAVSVTPQLRLKPIALPVEHGSWGFLLEPLVAAVIVAPSAAAPWIFLMSAGAFLARQPLKIVLSDWRAGRRLPQTSVAVKFAAAFGLAALAGFAGTLYFSGFLALAPVVLAAPFAGFQVYRDMLRKSRGLTSELLGAAAVASTAASVAIAAGWSAFGAAMLWLMFTARFIPSIVYVRNRLQLEKGKPWSPTAVISANLLAFAGVAALAVYGLIPALPVGIFALLTARAIWGVSPYRRRVKAMKIGIWEVIYGALLVASIVVGYLTNGGKLG